MLNSHRFLGHLMNILSPEMAVVKKEKADEIAVFIELPGIQNRDDISISVSTSKFTIKGVRHKLDSYRQIYDTSQNDNREKFEKTFILSCPVRPETASAVYSKGVLEIKLKKLAERSWDKVFVQFL